MQTSDQQYPVYLEVLESEIVYQMDADMLDEEEEEYYDKMPDDYNSTPSFVTAGIVAAGGNITRFYPLPSPNFQMFEMNFYT